MRKQLSKSDIAALNSQIESLFGRSDFFHKKDKVIVEDAAERKVVFKDGAPLFFYEGDMIIPTLKLLLSDSLLKTITVDMGAVKFVTNGADVMRPGIVRADDGIKRGDLVVVVDVAYGKPLAVCAALLSGDDIMSADSGKVLRNIHHVGDRLWALQ